MTIPWSVFCAIMAFHWVWDFILQSDWVARNKSKSVRILLLHGICYASWGIPAGLWLFPTLDLTVALTCWLFITHTCVDGITSRINSYLWTRGQVHWFFVGIGFDQMLHYLSIFVWIKNLI